MKKFKLIRDGGFRLAIMSMLAMFTFTCCSAHPSTNCTSRVQTDEQADSVMKTAIGDSIYRVIVDAKKVKAEEIKMTPDTTKTEKDMAVLVKSKHCPLVQFAITDPKIYKSNQTTYGNFMPCFKLTFIRKKETYVMNFDFGLKKWNICDAKGKQIKMFDLSSDDMLRIANMLFPKNELYKNLLNTDKR